MVGYELLYGLCLVLYRIGQVLIAFVVLGAAMDGIAWVIQWMRRGDE
jgi:hypothetical protein